MLHGALTALSMTWARRREVRRQARRTVRHGDPLAAQVAEQGRQITECRRQIGGLFDLIDAVSGRAQASSPESDSTLPLLTLIRSERDSA